jgi:hypothetical protein
MGIKQLLNYIKAYIFSKLYFLKVSEMVLSQQAVKEFEDLYVHFISTGKGDFIPYKSNFPRTCL